jgi:cation:H+ antiporter
MTEVFAKFGISLLFLVISADLLLKFVEKFASRIKISPLIIGATLIAVGTSLPETSVAFSSIAQGVPEISFGDIIGSNIANICLILGLGIVLFPVKIGTNKTQKNNIILLILTFVFIGMFFIPQEYRRLLGIGLVIFYAAFLIVEIFWGKIGSLKEDRKNIAKMEKTKGNTFLYLLGTVVSLAGLVLSSKYLVSSAVTISKVLNISDEMIGLSVIAFGTSLPELATTIISGIKRDWKLMYGDIQGSNIYNLSIIGSILLVFGNSRASIEIFPLIFMAASTIVIVILSHRYEGSHIPRFYGLIFILAYALYIFKLYKF